MFLFCWDSDSNDQQPWFRKQMKHKQALAWVHHRHMPRSVCFTRPPQRSQERDCRTLVTPHFQRRTQWIFLSPFRMRRTLEACIKVSHISVFELFGWFGHLGKRRKTWILFVQPSLSHSNLRRSHLRLEPEFFADIEDDASRLDASAFVCICHCFNAHQTLWKGFVSLPRGFECP